MMEPQTTQQTDSEMRRWSEQIEVAGNQLTQRVKELVQEGSVRRLRISTSSDRLLLETPLLVGAAVGAAVTIYSPMFTTLVVLAALLAKVKLEVLRTDSVRQESAGPGGAQQAAYQSEGELASRPGHVGGELSRD